MNKVECLEEKAERYWDMAMYHAWKTGNVVKEKKAVNIAVSLDKKVRELKKN